jgi:hypothetical protein
MLDSETRVMTEELLEWFPLMRGGVIQENDDGAAQLGSIGGARCAVTIRRWPCE